MRLANSHNVSTTSSYSIVFHWFHLRSTHISHLAVVLASQPTVFAQHERASKIGWQHVGPTVNAEDNVRTVALLPINANNESVRFANVNNVMKTKFTQH